MELTKGNTLAFYDKVDVIYIDAMVDAAGQCYIYSGILSEFYLKRDGTLDRLVLSGTKRRRVDSDPHLLTKWMKNLGLDSRFYSIPGDYCILEYRTVLNLNITYASFDDFVSSDS